MTQSESEPQAQAAPKRRRQGRSPAFPFIPLGTALERAEAFRVAEGGRPKHFAPLASAARAWEIGPKTGQAMQTVAALGHFGLFEFEGSGGKRQARLTDAALGILLDKQPNSSARDKLIKDASIKPAIHEMLWKRWGAELPSDSTLETFLVLDRGFSENGATDLMAEYKATLAFAKLTQPANLSELQDGSQELEALAGNLETAEVPGSQKRRVAVAEARGEPMVKVTYTGDAVEVVARLRSQDGIEKIIRAIEAMRSLLPKSEGVKQLERETVERIEKDRASQVSPEDN